MAKGYQSLLSGRSARPLTEDDRKKVSNFFVGLDNTVPFRYDPNGRTVFRTFVDVDGAAAAEVVYGPDIFPGASVASANASLGVKAAVSHEISHYYRWINNTELANDGLTHIDEAMTSLEAILRFQRHLSEHEIQELVRDALQRLAMYAQLIEEESAK